MLKTCLTGIGSALLAVVLVKSLSEAPEAATVDLSGLETALREQSLRIDGLEKQLANRGPIEGHSSSEIDNAINRVTTRAEVEEILAKIVDDKKEEIAKLAVPKVQTPMTTYQKPDEETQRKWRERSADRMAQIFSARGLKDIEIEDWQKEKMTEIFKTYSVARSELWMDREMSREDREKKSEELLVERNKSVEDILTADQYTTFTKNMESSHSGWRR